MPRSSERIPMRVPVVIYGYAGKGGGLQEATETIIVNFSGALVTLKAKLALGDTVFLIHKSGGQEQEVRVVYLDTYSDRETRVGLAFKEPVSGFWKRTRKKPRVPKTFRVIVKRMALGVSSFDNNAKRLGEARLLAGPFPAF